MWYLVCKEKKHAWIQTILQMGKISINMVLWILAYAIYSKSTVFVKKAKIELRQPEYMETDMLATDKIQLVYLSGVVVTGVIAVGIGILFWCITRSDMKKKKSKMSLLMALGYQTSQIYRYYLYSILIDTLISIIISGIFSFGVWRLYLACSKDYVEMLKFVGVEQTMNLYGIVYSLMVSLVIQAVILGMLLHSIKRGNIREMMTEK